MEGLFMASKYPQSNAVRLRQLGLFFMVVGWRWRHCGLREGAFEFAGVLLIKVILPVQRTASYDY